MTLTRRSLFASAVALLALPRRVAAEKLLGPVPGQLFDSTWTSAPDGHGHAPGTLVIDTEGLRRRHRTFAAHMEAAWAAWAADRNKL